jgi:hypothetical protein
MNPFTFSGRSSGKMEEHYEELRHNALAGRREASNWGLALFCRRGMLAWMKAWLACAPVKDVPIRKKIEGRPDVPQDIRGNMIMLLVNMVLDGRKETGIC